VIRHCPPGSVKGREPIVRIGSAHGDDSSVAGWELDVRCGGTAGGIAARPIAACPLRTGRARVDPGSEGEEGQGQPGADPASDVDDFFDDIIDTFKLGVLIIAIAIALPFILFVVILIARMRQRRARGREVREAGERSADEELVALGDEIRELDLDTSMPNASRGALTEYEQAIRYYDQANELLAGDPTEYRVEQARAAMAAGRRHLAATRERLD
jgi:hypothetical protein